MSSVRASSSDPPQRPSSDMFNAPRARPPGSFSFNGATSSSPTNLTSSYDPLAFNDPDPWSAAPSPSHTPAYTPPPPPPPATSGFGSNGNAQAGGLVDEDKLSPVYELALEVADPYGRGEGGVSVTVLGRVLSSSSLGSAEVERIINIVSSSKPRVTKHEFYLALVLVALSQEGSEPSIDQALARRNNPPTPSLNLESVSSAASNPSSSSFSSTANNPQPDQGRPASDHTSAPSTNSSHYVPPTFPPPVRATTPPPPPPAVPERRQSHDPWSTATSSPPQPTIVPASHSYPSSLVAPTASALKGGLLAIDRWWEKETRVRVRLIPEREGKWPGLKYTVFAVEVARQGVEEGAGGVHRRFSEFVWLHECLVKRYPFRCIVSLPPKRLGADGSFLEQRRRGLSRFLNFVVNHPTLKADHLVQVFLHETNLESWRKSTPISLEEEGKGKVLTEREEMEVPGDLEDKLAIARRLLTPKINSWSNLVVIFERHSRRLEALGADSSRFAMALSSLVEASAESWKGGLPIKAVAGWGGAGEERERDELGDGVREGLKRVGQGFEQLAGGADLRSQQLLLTTLEALKAQRDLFLAFRELYARHDRLSVDPIPRLQKKIETSQTKLLAVQNAKKPSWEIEADKLAGTIEAAQAEVKGWLARRGVVRSIMWQELAFLVHPRENTLVTLAFQQFAREEATFSEETTAVWRRMESGLEDMPLE